MTLMSLVALSTLLIFSSCNKEEAGDSQFTATMESCTDIQGKTVLNGTNLNWVSGDQIAIYGTGGNGIYSATPQTPATTAAFTRVSGNSVSAPCRAYYPAALTTDGMNITLPATQTYVAGSMQEFPMYAESNTNTLAFRNLCGALKLHLTKANTSISSIAVTAATPINGTFTVNYNNGDPVLTPVSISATSVTGTTTVLTCATAQAIDNGADFLCILATTGETPCLSNEEKTLIRQQIVRQVKGRVPILMGCGGNNTAAVVDELRNADIPGIDGILSVCPYYNKPSQEGLFQHFKAIAQATSLPVVLYNVPGRTGINMKAETTCRIAQACDNVVAIKEASGSLEQVDEIIKNKPDRFEVISGDDALTYPMVACGAVGVISVIGNALPKEFSRMIRLEFNNEFAAARQIHHRFTDLYSLLFVDGNPAGVKALLHEMGFIENVLRLPLVPTRVATLQKMSDILKSLKR